MGKLLTPFMLVWDMFHPIPANLKLQGSWHAATSQELAAHSNNGFLFAVYDSMASNTGLKSVILTDGQQFDVSFTLTGKSRVCTVSHQQALWAWDSKHRISRLVSLCDKGSLPSKLEPVG